MKSKTKRVRKDTNNTNSTTHTKKMRKHNLTGGGVLNDTETEICNLIVDQPPTDKLKDKFKDKFKDVLGEGDAKIRRIVSEHTFFEGEDVTFMSIVQNNIQLFCFENVQTDNPSYFKKKNTNPSSNSDKYSVFCLNMFDKCLKTPPLLYEIILDAISEETVYKNFEKDSVIKDVIITRITEAHKDVETSIIDGKDASDNQTTAKIMSILSDEIKYHISNFIVNILIKSIIEYKEKASEGLDRKVYTGKIHMEQFIIKLIIQIINSGSEEGDGASKEGGDGASKGRDAQQSGGSNTNTNTNTKKSMSVTELKNIDVDKLQQGLKDCANRERLKKELENKQEEGPTKDEANYGEAVSDDGAPLSAKPWFLYVVFGVLAFTTTIELGIFDAPQCLTHTFI
jgi:hypothetical protein